MEAKLIRSAVCFSTFQIKYYKPWKLSLFVQLVCFSTFQMKYDAAKQLPCSFTKGDMQLQTCHFHNCDSEQQVP